MKTRANHRIATFRSDVDPPKVQERRPAMFSALMKNGGYEVVYLNRSAAGSPDALGFYVRGKLDPAEPYSREAKRHLMAGMVAIQQEHGPENLVSIYLDVDQPENLNRPAYRQLKDDLRAGMFRKVYVFPADDLLGHPQVVEDLLRLYCEVGGFEILSPQPVSLLQASTARRLAPSACMEAVR